MRIFAMMLILLWHIKDHFMPSNSWGGGGGGKPPAIFNPDIYIIPRGSFHTHHRLFWHKTP